MKKTHFVCVIIYRTNPANGELEFLVVDSYSTDPKSRVRSLKQVKFPGGTNRECPDESVALTRDREAWEEVHLAFLKSKEVWRKEAKPDQPQDQHTQHGFLVDFNDCSGEIRKAPIIDDGAELSSPRWVPAATLGRELFHSHQAPYLAACRELRIF